MLLYIYLLEVKDKFLNKVLTAGVHNKSLSCAIINDITNLMYVNSNVYKLIT